MSRDRSLASLPIRLVLLPLPFDAVVNWVEKGVAPQTILASKPIQGGKRTRPLCPYPAEARWSGAGSSDDAVNFSCQTPKRGN